MSAADHLEKNTTDSISEIAAAWFDRLDHEDVSEDVRASFKSWLEQSQKHRSAYEAVERGWTVAQSAATDPQILALRHETALRLTRQTASKVRAPRWAVAAALLLFLGAALAVGLWRFGSSV